MTFGHVVFGEMVPKSLAIFCPGQRRTPAHASARAGLAGHAAGDRLAQLAGHPRSAYVQGRTEGRGDQPLHPSSGGRHHRAVTARRPLVDHSGTLAGAFEFTDKPVAEVEVGLDNVVTTSGYLHMKVVVDLGPDEFAVPIPHKRIRRLVADPRQTALEDVIEVLVGEVSDVA